MKRKTQKIRESDGSFHLEKCLRKKLLQQWMDHRPTELVLFVLYGVWLKVPGRLDGSPNWSNEMVCFFSRLGTTAHFIADF